MPMFGKIIPTPGFPLLTSDGLQNLKAIYGVPLFPICLNVLLFNDCQLLNSCGLGSDLGSLAADSSGALVSKTQLSSFKVTECVESCELLA